MSILKFSNIYGTRVFKKSNAYSTKYILVKKCRLSGFEEIGCIREPTDGEIAKLLGLPPDPPSLSSLCRSRATVRDYVLNDNFKYFFTLTISPDSVINRMDSSEVFRKMRERFKNLKKFDKSFKYLFILEEHEKGGFHLHGFCSDNDMLNLEPYKKGLLNSIYFNRIGFNSFSKIRDVQKTASYATKYITKKCVRSENGTSYCCSRNLKKSEKIELSLDKLKELDLKLDYENDFIKIFS